jgi:phosphate:Na+ symporter
MTTLAFLINLAGATMLLLFAVRMVQTGIERSMGPSFRRMVTARKDSRVRTAFAGVVLAIILQSATAVALLASGFAASGILTFTGGLALLLGADLGSALVIQVLSFQLDWLVPLLLTLGGYMFLKVDSRRAKQYGRILLGVAFILLALRLIGHAMDPIRESNFLPAIAGYLKSDFITAFLVGAAVSFVMHSSVAAILMVVTFTALGVLPFGAGVSLILGANLGGALLAVWLTRGMPIAARRIPLGNLVLRGSAAVVVLLIVNYTPVLAIYNVFEEGQALVAVHLTFNASLLVITLPFIGLLDQPLRAILPDTNGNGSDDPLAPVSVLDWNVIDTPKLALASVTREVLRMNQIVEVMTRPVMELYESGDTHRINEVRALDEGVNTASTDIRRYVASLKRENMSKAEYRRSRELTEYSINLESAGDIIAKTLMPLAKEKARQQLKFSKDGWNELVSIHERVIANMNLAFNALVYEDIEYARLLIAEKTEMAAQERKSRKKHLKRLREGLETSFESSDIHLETLRGLKDLNSQISAVAYPILIKNGQLLESRLIDTMDDGDEAEKTGP